MNLNAATNNKISLRNKHVRTYLSKENGAEDFYKFLNEHGYVFKRSIKHENSS